MLLAAEQELICARRRPGWGPRLIAGETGHPNAIVWRALRGPRSRVPERLPRDAARRSEWPCPGAPAPHGHEALQCFTRTGWRYWRPSAHGTEKRIRIGHEFVHSIVDDHTRLAHTEIHPDERAATVSAFTARALAFFESLEREPGTPMSGRRGRAPTRA